MHFHEGRIFLWEGSRNENIDVFMNERRIKTKTLRFLTKKTRTKCISVIGEFFSERERGKNEENVYEPVNDLWKKERKPRKTCGLLLENVYPYGENFSPKGTEE